MTEDARLTGAALEQRLLGRKEEILEDWRRAVLATYPAETASFAMAEKDPFCDPIGHALIRTGHALWEMAMTGMERQRAEENLRDIVRIRAVQDFSPSQALSFVDAMRKAIRRKIPAVAVEKTGLNHLLCIESRLDEAMFVAVDLYVACKKQIDDIRIREAKAANERLLRLIKAMDRRGEPGDLREPSRRGKAGGTPQ